MFVTPGLFLIFTVTVLVLLYFHLTRHFKYWKNRNVPYQKPVPVFGNAFKILAMKLSLGEYLRELYRSTNSPYVGFFMFDQPFLLLRDPQLIKQCLIKNFEYFDDRSVTENRRDDELGSDILFLMKNPSWRTMRIKLSPVFSSRKMKNMLPLMLEAAKDFCEYLNKVAINENSTNARDICMKFTTDVISSCAFGINAECFKHEKAAFRETSRRLFDFNTSRKIQMSAYFFAPILVKLFRMKFIEPTAGKFMKEVFLKTLEEREKSNVPRGDLIDVLLQIKRESSENNQLFQGDMLVAQAVQFFSAGFESTGSTVSFTLYEMSLNREIQSRLRNEIRNVVKKHGEITYEAIQQMNYLDMVVNETLRLYPVVPFLDRRCKRTHTLPGSDLVVEKDIPIYISLLGLHYDPQYFPNPEKYDPERFSPENKESRPGFCYMPVGEGPRNCIGARFGILSSKVAIARLLYEFEVEATDDTPVPLKFDPNGFLISPEQKIYIHFKRASDADVAI